MELFCPYLSPETTAERFRKNIIKHLHAQSQQQEH